MKNRYSIVKVKDDCILKDKYILLRPSGYNSIFNSYKEAKERLMYEIKEDKKYMRFDYKGKTFELMEMKEPNKNTSFDIIGIFEVVPHRIINNEIVKCSWDECEFEKYEFVDYFYGVTGKEIMITNAKEFIDKYLKENKED